MITRIKVIAPPKSNWPEEIRRAWLGVEMPIHRTAFDPGLFASNYNSMSGYLVLGRDAHRALIAAGRTTAAKFWGEIISPVSRLRFPYECCIVVATT